MSNNDSSNNSNAKAKQNPLVILLLVLVVIGILSFIADSFTELNKSKSKYSDDYKEFIDQSERSLKELQKNR